MLQMRGLFNGEHSSRQINYLNLWLLFYIFHAIYTVRFIEGQTRCFIEEIMQYDRRMSFKQI